MRTLTRIAWISILICSCVGSVWGGSEWSGVDETVVEKFAEEAGRPPRDPFINTDQGDLLLFVFLVAGAAGGFVCGYCFRSLFPPKRQVMAAEASNV